MLKIYFGNGMFTDRADAKLSKLALQSALRNSFPNYKVIYDISYNNNETFMYQVVELLRQKGIQDWTQLFKWLADIELGPDWFEEDLLRIATQFNSAEHIVDSDLRSHVASYKQAIAQCQKVLLVAHSQGNFYGNAAWQQVYSDTIEGLPLSKIRAMGMISVGTPASHIGQPLFYDTDQLLITEYTTLDGDILIDALRLLGRTPLVANHTTRQATDDWLRHRFISTYLAIGSTRIQIFKQIKQVAGFLETLPFDRQPLSSSALASAGYDGAAQILEIEFLSSGSVYRYYNVPDSVFQALVSASSVGGYYNSYIRGQYPSRRLY